jgi:hypothetical protein
MDMERSNQNWISNMRGTEDLFDEHHNVEGERHISQDINGKYWFWDETGADGYGPFNDIPACREALRNYGRTLG